MAKRRSSKPKVNKEQIIEAFAEMARMKNIDRDLLQGIMEDTFAQMVRKKYGLEAEFDIVVNMDKGDIEIYLIREVVETAEEIEDPSLQISLEDANKGEEEYEVEDEHLTEPEPGEPGGQLRTSDDLDGGTDLEPACSRGGEGEHHQRVLGEAERDYRR